MKPDSMREKSIVLWVIAGVLLLFYAITGGLALKLRKELRAQVINRDAEILMVVASAEIDDVRLINEGIFEPGADEELFEVALNTSEIEGVIGVRVFKENNKSLGGIPISIKRGQLKPEEEIVLNKRTPISRFKAESFLTDIFLMIDEETADLSTFSVLEIIIPLFSKEDETVSGYAEYFIDGSDLEVELQSMDADVFTYAGGAVLLGSLLGGGILFWAFKKLRKVNQLLEDRTRNLISANHKLSMEARTAAIGAITSHLIHGLKSPLQGIRQLVTTQSIGDGDGSGEQVWQDAADTTERMQLLINEVIEVLQDRGGEFTYEITCSEIANLAEERVTHYAVKKSVALKIECGPSVSDFQLSNDRANLVVLILVNLIRNAIDASPSGGTVLLKIEEELESGVSFSVIDQGEGLPSVVAENIFQPVTSAKLDGSGVGLSLCQELSRHLQGELTLASTGPQGTVFKLHISKLPVIREIT